MPTEKAKKQVEELKKAFEDSPLVITAQFTGLKMAQLTGLRAALKPTKSRFRVVKNTLAKIAADGAGRAAVREVMGGPIGVVTSQGDPAATAKALVNYLQTSPIDLKLRGGVLVNQVLTPARIEELAKLPPKDQLIAKLLGQMMSPAAGLVTVLSGPVRGLAVALQRIAEQKGMAAAAALEASRPAETAPAEPAGAPASA
jgi:large subunit ribosomal protein L10